MWSAKYLPHMNHVCVSPTNRNGSTQEQRKTLTRLGIEPTTFGFDHRCSSDWWWATRSDGSRPWELKMLYSRQWTSTSTRKDYVFGKRWPCSTYYLNRVNWLVCNVKCSVSTPYEPCPCVGPFPLVGLTLTWFIWGRNLALHMTL